MKKISVLMPIYNAMPFLPEAIASILNQSFDDFELLALNDASTDGTTDYLNSITDARVRVLQLPKANLALNLNIGLEQATGEYIARMDADDVSRPERFAAQVAYLDSHPEVVLVGCQCTTINSTGQTTGELVYDTDPAIVQYRLLFDSPVPHPGTMFRTAAARQAGGYVGSMFPVEDYDFWTRLSRFGSLANLPQTLLDYRIHGNNVSVLRVDEQKRMAARVSREFILERKLATKPETATLFRDTIYGDPNHLTKQGALAVAEVWTKAVEASCQPHQLAGWLRSQAKLKSERCGRLSAASLRWLRLMTYADPAAFHPTRLFRRVLGRPTVV